MYFPTILWFCFPLPGPPAGPFNVRLNPRPHTLGSLQSLQGVGKDLDGLTVEQSLDTTLGRGAIVLKLIVHEFVKRSQDDRHGGQILLGEDARQVWVDVRGHERWSDGVDGDVMRRRDGGQRPHQTNHAVLRGHVLRQGGVGIETSHARRDHNLPSRYRILGGVVRKELDPVVHAVQIDLECGHVGLPGWFRRVDGGEDVVVVINARVEGGEVQVAAPLECLLERLGLVFEGRDVRLDEQGVLCIQARVLGRFL